MKLWPGDVWYPEKSVCNNYGKGELTTQIEWTVESADFSTEPSREVFTLAALDPAVGTEFGGSHLENATDADGWSGVWDRAKLVDEKEWRARQIDEATQAREVSSPFPTGIMVIAAAVVGYALYRWRAGRLVRSI